MRVKINYYNDAGQAVRSCDEWAYRVIDRYTNYGVFIYQTMEFNKQCQAEYYDDPQTIDELITNLQYYFKFVNPQWYGVTYTPTVNGIYITYMCPSMYGLEFAGMDFIIYPKGITYESMS